MGQKKIDHQSEDNSIERSLASEGTDIGGSTITLKSSDSQIVSMKTPIMAAMFALMAGALGTGMFNLPLRITHIGVAFFLLYISISALFSYIGCHLLHKLILKTKYESYG
jgi:hypothetical protein